MITRIETTPFGDQTVYVCNREEALALLRKSRGKGSKYMIGVPVQLPIEGEPGKVFPGYTTLKVSLTDMLEAVDKLLQNLEKRGGRIEITVKDKWYSI